jgi:septal ring factor EnvC (AmiA/AmiB activator)
MQAWFVAARRVSMSPIFLIPARSCLVLALTFALAACGSPAPPKADAPSVEQRLSELERRVDMLEARPEVQPPYRSKAEIQANIEALEAERSKLLTHYYPQHPEIKDIDRRLEILNSQLQMLEQP